MCACMQYSPMYNLPKRFALYISPNITLYMFHTVSNGMKMHRIYV